MKTEFTWHVVINEEKTILAVYGQAILSDAQKKAADIEHRTGLPVQVEQIRLEYPNRPHVGEKMPLACESCGLATDMHDLDGRPFCDTHAKHEGNW